MKHFAKILALLLTLAMLLGMLPTVAFAAGSTEDVWDLINDYEATHLKRSRKAATADDYAAMAGDIAELVMKSDDYKEGTCTYDAESGNSFFFWESADGEPNGYSPRLRARIHQTAVADAEPEDYAGIETVSYATRGGSPSSKNVAVFQPYYGIDSSFTTQYKTEGESIAKATGGTCTTYKTTNATITQIGAALSNCGVVIFDSHGDTDYYVSGSEDYVTRANTSYLCLQSSSGWTSADKAQATGEYNTYYHAYDAGSNGSMHYYCFDGTAMANHMTANATPNNLVWMAICLGMATTGLHAPLLSHGVGVVYGYSQSVTFNGDYAYEEDFWTKMKAGENVATAFNYMTNQNGKWDSYSSYNTIGKARYNYAAFPNVVSAEDTYQGHRSENPSNNSETSLTYTAKYGACNVQTVNSTWTLFAQHEITASSNNTNYGTVSISGSTITASPKTGYTYASPAYTVTPSGAATVTQSGNTFTVSATADCNVRINFAAKQKATITYIANSNDITANVGSSTQYYTGDTITLPGVDTGSNAAQGYTFLGWVTQTCDGLTQAPQYAGKGTQVQLTSANSTFYALYSKTTSTGNEGNTGNTYTKITSTDDLADGNYLIVYEDGNVAFDGSLNTLDAVENTKPVTISDNKITTNEAIYFVYDSSANTLKSASGYYIGNTSNSNELKSSTTEAYSNTIGFSNGSADIVSSSSYLRFNSASNQLRFRYYKSSSYTNQKAVALYKAGAGGTTTYTTNPAPHVHDAQLVSAVAPTCGEEGHSAYYYCAGCGKYFSDSAAANEITRESTAIAPTGNHSYGAWTQDGTAGHTHTCSVCGNSETVAHTNSDVVTAPTATTMGYTTHTCTTCNYVYVDTYTAALGSDFTVSFSVPSGVTQPASMVSNTNTGITLPTPVGTPDGEADGYTFLGWVDSTVDNDTSKPEYLEAEENYIAEQNVTLKALYSYVVSDESGSTEQVWKRMEEDSELSAGIQLVFASDGKDRTAGDISSTYMSEVTSSFDNGTISSLGNDTVVMTLGGSDGAWTFSYEDALLGTNAAKSLGWGSGTTTWTISISGGNATIASTDDTCGRLLHNVNANRFTTYTSNTNTSMLLPQIYYLTGSAGTTYYTTEITPPCAHTGITWTSNGNGTHSGTCPSTCGKTITEACSYNAQNVCTVCGYHRPTYTVTFSVPGGVTAVNAQTCLAGESITLPTANEPEGYTFLGWVTTDYNNVSTAPSSILTGSYTATANVTLKALYTYTESNAATNEYALVTSLSNANKVILYNPDSGVAVSNAQSSVASYPERYRAGVNVTPVNSKITTTNTAIVWTVEIDTNGIAFKDADGSYLSTPSNYSNLVLNSDCKYWTVTEDNGLFFVISTTSAGSSGDLRGIEYYQGKFTTHYANNTNLTNSRNAFGMELYVQLTGTPYWTTVIAAACEHPNASNAWTHDDTYHWHVCPDCTVHVSEAAHTYDNGVVTAPTANDQGYTTYTCTVCGQSYVDDYVPALGTDYTVSFTVPTGVAAVASMTCNSNSSITLPTAGAPEGYTFLGWVTGDYDNVTTAPGTILTGSYTATGNVTLNALYTYTQGGGDVTTYTDTLTREDTGVDSGSSNYKDWSGVTKESDAVYAGQSAGGNDSIQIRTKNSNSGVITTATGGTATKVTVVWAAGNATDRTIDIYGKTSAYSSPTDLFNSSTQGTKIGSLVYETSTELIIPADSGYTHIGIRSKDGAAYLTSISVTWTSGDPGTPYWTTVIASAPAHSSAFLEGQAATCEEPGVQDYYYCTDCLNDPNGEHYGKMYSDAAMTTEILDATIPALGHNFTVHPATSDDDHYLAPTCTDAGIEYLQCSRCDAWDEDGQVIAALGHSLTATPANSATCTTAGNSAYWTCSTCGKYFSDAAGTTEIQANSWVIAATGHTSSYVDNGDGTHDEVCSVCGTVLTDNEAHVYDNGVCVGCGAFEPVEEALELVSAAPVLNDKIDMVYAAKVPDGYTNPYVVFSFNGVNTTVTECTTDVNGNLNFVFTDVNPQCMGDNITATLYATKNGSEESVSVTNYSVRQYCVNQLAREDISASLRTLLSDLLAYGAAAQTYMGYKTNALVNADTGLTNEQLTPSAFPVAGISGKDASFTGTASTDVYWLSAGLTLTNSVAMNFRFYAASAENLSVTVSVNGRTRTFTEFTSCGNNIYEVSFTGIDADEFSDTVTASFSRSGAAVGNTLSYSVNTYVQSKQSDSNTALQALVKALYNYGASAANYNG